MFVEARRGGEPPLEQRFGDASAQHSQGIATDPEGNVVVTGYFAGTLSFGGGALTSAGSDDIFLAKLAR